MAEQNKRQLKHDIDSIHIERWSPRAFSTQAVTEKQLHCLLEAARWAPSAGNFQPWSFVYAYQEADRERFLSFINDTNIAWCHRVPAFIMILSRKTVNEEGVQNPFASFDTGAAWGYLSLEAHRQGLITRAMGGFNKEKARSLLRVPEEYELEAVVAVGYHDPEAVLDERDAEREEASDRKRIESFSFEGEYRR